VFRIAHFPRHTMDVRFYPTAGATAAMPGGDPQNLDFGHCLGYYNFNKVRHPLSILI